MTRFQQIGISVKFRVFYIFFNVILNNIITFCKLLSTMRGRKGSTSTKNTGTGVLYNYVLESHLAPIRESGSFIFLNKKIQNRFTLM